MLTPFARLMLERLNERRTSIEHSLLCGQCNSLEDYRVLVAMRDENANAIEFVKEVDRVLTTDEQPKESK